MTQRKATRQAAWDHLRAAGADALRFDVGSIAQLPAPARRLLTASLVPDAALAGTVVLQMEGRIRLGRWLPFTARQVLSVGRGFVWAARVGWGPLVVTGHDMLVHEEGGLDFRLWGLVPVARAAGADIDRSTVGRLAAETVAWAPQGLTPAMGATWTGVDDHRAVVTLPVGSHRVDVTVTVDDDGHATELSLARWGNPDGGAFDWHSFGGSVTGWDTFEGTVIGTRGTVGWHWDTPDRRATFFEWAVTDIEVSSTDERTGAATPP